MRLALTHAPCVSVTRDLCVTLWQAVLAARAPDLALEVRVRQGLRDQVMGVLEHAVSVQPRTTTTLNPKPWTPNHKP